MATDYTTTAVGTIAHNLRGSLARTRQVFAAAAPTSTRTSTTVQSTLSIPSACRTCHLALLIASGLQLVIHTASHLFPLLQTLIFRIQGLGLRQIRETWVVG